MAVMYGEGIALTSGLPLYVLSPHFLQQPVALQLLRSSSEGQRQLQGRDIGR